MKFIDLAVPYKMEEGIENLTWEEKYNQAEFQIQNFRTQAGRVRELLNEKVREILI